MCVLVWLYTTERGIIICGRQTSCMSEPAERGMFVWREAVVLERVWECVARATMLLALVISFDKIRLFMARCEILCCRVCKSAYVRS